MNFSNDSFATNSIISFFRIKSIDELRKKLSDVEATSGSKVSLVIFTKLNSKKFT